MRLSMRYTVTLILFSVCFSVVTNTHGQELDSEIQEVIRAHLCPEGPPVQTDVAINDHHLGRLTALSMRQRTIESFVPFQSSRLRSLRLYNCRVQDLASIRHVTGIAELHLCGCGIINISPLADLTELTYLSLTDNKIEDVSVLSNCGRLTWLDLRDNKINGVSVLKSLSGLRYVDLRDNPLGNATDADIRAIKESNPGIRILLGRQSGNSKTEIEQQLDARAKIAEFALCARLRYEDGVACPSLPGLRDDLPREIAEALAHLKQGGDEEYLADIAALLMRYTIEMETYYRPGGILDSNEPLLAAFLTGVGVELGGATGTPTMAVGYWILGNRDRLAPSLYLDMQIDNYRDAHQRLIREGIFTE